MKTTLRHWRAAFLPLLLMVFFAASKPAGAQGVFSQFSLTQPTNGATFFAGSDIKLLAHVLEDADNGTIMRFFSNQKLIGVVSNGVQGLDESRNFTFVWTNVPVGVYALAAESVGRLAGRTAWSQTNTVIVLPSHYISVDLVQPTNGQVYAGPSTISLLGGASDTNGAIAFVEFFDGSYEIGLASNGLVLDPPFPPGWKFGDRAFLLNWTNQSIGTHVLTAAVLDTNGETAYSAPVTVIIGSNIPPNVQVTSPPNNATVYAPVNLSLLAYANDPDGYIATVQFFAGTTNLGFAQALPPAIAVPLVSGVPPPASSPPLHSFILTWTNPPVGAYELTAVATDGLGASSTSAPVSISILAPVTPPPTNLPDLAGVIATDPIAIASTNCWVWRGLTNGLGTWTQWVSPVAVWRWYTNCGPKDATFTVQRFGSTVSDLLVNYSFGGSATNGVDYAALPGSVTIPAGEKTADITIVPFQNGSNYTRTVALILDASTNAPPDYLVGSDSRAEVLITDNPLEGFPAAVVLGDGSFHFSLTGPNGAWFHVDYSTNLVDWTVLCTNQVIDGTINFVDPNANGARARIYRTVPMAGPPAD